MNTGHADAGRMDLSRQMKQLLRELKKTSENEQNLFTGTSQDKINGFPDLSGSPEGDKDDEVEKPVKYNCKEVETKIQRAKTSVSAGQAVISAKRKVLEVKRKIASSDGDSEELQLALTHAKRMEMVARKKKHHLELEEMVQIAGKRDERLDKPEESSAQIKNAVITAQEEEVTKREDAILHERQKQIYEAAEQVQDNDAQNSHDILSDLNKMLAEFGEEELKELEEAMEMLESMEIVDPHMSKEELVELKRKHRTAEQKAMVKADMDYLKGMVKHQMEKSAAVPALSSQVASGGMPSVGIPQTLDAVNISSFSSSGTMGSISIDLQV